MSNGFIDLTVRVEKKRVGDFFEDISVAAPYAQVIRWTVAVPSLKALPAPEITKVPEVVAGNKRLSKQQRAIMALIESGISSRSDLQEASGMPNVMRVINNLKLKYRLIKGNVHEGFVSLRKDQ